MSKARKWLCEVCSESFSSKTRLVKHLKDEIEEAEEYSMNAECDIDVAEEQLKQLKKSD